MMEDPHVSKISQLVGEHVPLSSPPLCFFPPPNLQLPQPFIKDGAMTEIQRDKGCDSAAGGRREEGTDEMLIFVPPAAALAV